MAYYHISTDQKRALSTLLARKKEGHGQFGIVEQRKPFRDDDDDEGGSGLPSPFEAHPLLGNQPIGASSDLIADVSRRNQHEMIDEAADRGDELSPDLQAKPKMQATMTMKNTHIATPKPN